MSEEMKKKKHVVRQDWEPNETLKVLAKIWQFVFAGIKIALGAVATVLLICVVCGFVFVGILGDYLQDDILPMANMVLEDYEYEQNSYLYYVDSDGQIQEYQKIFAETSSNWASYEDIPKNLVNAAIAIEDHRFYEHQGVDWVTTVKATARMFFGDDSAGGSSITQQLIKNLLLTEDESADEVTVRRKVLEIFRAIQLEKTYSKETIMELYLNFIYLGQGCRGVRTAAETYFGKELEMLTLAECASLIGITNNPSMFDPYSNDVYTFAGEERDGMGRNRYRQELVLGAMLEYEMITREEYDEAMAQEIVLKNGVDDEDTLTRCTNEECGHKNTKASFLQADGSYACPVCGTAVSVDTSLSQQTYSWFTDVVLDDLAQQLADLSGMAWNDATKDLMLRHIQRSGYHIYTTLDMKVQEQVDKIYQDLTQIPDVRSGQQLQSAIVVIDNRTGDIVALAGGVGEKEGFHDWNRATDSKLQSGSSIKPISAYAPAFEAGAITPATVITDLPYQYDKKTGAWPMNDDRLFRYSRTVYSGVVNSVNAVATNTVDLIGINYAFEFAKEKMGISSLVEGYYDEDAGFTQTDMALAPLALGAQTWGVHVRDMANAFSTFANKGTYREGRTFSKVYDSQGTLVLDNAQETEELLSEKTIDYMNYCLVGGVNSGTGWEAKINGITTAGKTGTTGDNKDKWFCGFTGYYTAAVWSGFDKPEVIYANGNPSSQLFKKVMQPLHTGLEDVKLFDETKMVEVSVCLDCGKLATAACHNDVRVALGTGITRVAKANVYPEDVPKGSCTCHVEVDYCMSGNGVANEYCKHFAEVDSTLTVSQKALVKLTQSDLDEILQASKYNLLSPYYMNEFVYLITENGKDGSFKGFKGNINESVDAPYKVCTVHTKEAWDEYVASHPVKPDNGSGSDNWLDDLFG